MSMDNVFTNALIKLNHSISTKQQFALHKFNSPTYGVKIQHATPIYLYPPLSAQGKKKNHSTLGQFLYYGWAIDYTILTGINDISQ